MSLKRICIGLIRLFDFPLCAPVCLPFPPKTILEYQNQQINYSSEIRNTGLFRIINSGQTIVITSCFEEDVSYLFCSVRFRTESPFYFSYSTEAQVCFSLFLKIIIIYSHIDFFYFIFIFYFKVVRKNIMELPDASIAYMDGFQSGFAMNLGEEKFVSFFYFPFFLATPHFFCSPALIFFLLVMIGPSLPPIILSVFSLFPLLLIWT